jgi:hypothetical protein
VPINSNQSSCKPCFMNVLSVIAYKTYELSGVILLYRVYPLFDIFDSIMCVGTFSASAL